MKELLLLPALVALAATATAQPGYLGVALDERAWPTPLGAANFTGIAAGLLHGAGYPDVAILQNGTPAVFAAPATFNALVTIPGAPTGCTAIATRHLTRATSGRWRDALVVSNTSGLWHWYDSGNGMAWQLVDSDWPSVQRLVTADINVGVDELQDLIAVTDGGFAVRVKLAQGDGYGVDFAHEFSAPVHALAAIEWNGAPPREIAVATANGLEICSFAAGLPTVQAVSGTAGSDATLVTVRQPAPAAAFLAITTCSGTTWTLQRVMPGTVSATGSVPLGSLGIVECAAGDIDGDGDDEVVYSQRVNHRATIMLQRPGYFFAYTPADAVEVALLSPVAQPEYSAMAAPDNNATPLFADLDGDELADLVHPIESRDLVVVARNPLGGPSSATVEYSEATLPASGSGTLTLTIASSPPAGATHWEVVAWPLLWQDGFESDPANEPSVDLQSATSSDLSVAFPGSMANNPSAALLVQVRALTKAGSNVVRTFKPLTYIYMHDELGLQRLNLSAAWQAALGYKDPSQPVREVATPKLDGSSGGGEIPVIPPPPSDPPPTGPG